MESPAITSVMSPVVGGAASDRMWVLDYTAFGQDIINTLSLAEGDVAFDTAFEPYAWFREDSIDHNGSDVQLWRNKTGSLNADTPAGTSITMNDPAFVANASHGRPAVDFDNTNDEALVSGTPSDWQFLHNGAGFALSAVRKHDNGLAGNRVIFATKSNNSALGIFYYQTSTNLLAVQIGNGTTNVINGLEPSGYTVPDDEWQVLGLAHADRNGVGSNDLKFWINGSFTGAIGNTSYNDGTSSYGLYFGRDETASFLSKSQFSEAIIFDEDISDDVMTQVQGYQKARYGIS